MKSSTSLLFSPSADASSQPAAESRIHLKINQHLGPVLLQGMGSSAGSRGAGSALGTGQQAEGQPSPLLLAPTANMSPSPPEQLPAAPAHTASFCCGMAPREGEGRVVPGRMMLFLIPGVFWARVLLEQCPMSSYTVRLHAGSMGHTCDL